jgi:hypothetical protein
VEFGLCKQEGELRVYGAGLLSSVAELRHAVTCSEKTKRFDPEVTCREECIITAFQNAYYYTDSFEEAKDKMRWAEIHQQYILPLSYLSFTEIPKLMCICEYSMHLNMVCLPLKERSRKSKNKLLCKSPDKLQNCRISEIKIVDRETEKTCAHNPIPFLLFLLCADA